jgi:hypothetical protein
MGAVSAADFFQDRAAFSHDLRYSKSAADFDQFTAGNDYFLALCEGIQPEENRRGIVVHNGSGFRPVSRPGVSESFLHAGRACRPTNCTPD